MGYQGGTINNAGTFRKSGGTGTSVIGNGVNFNNSGTVEMDSGTLSFQGTCTGNNARYVVNGGGQMNIAGGVWNLTGSNTFTGSGVVSVTGTAQLWGSSNDLLGQGLTVTLNGSQGNGLVQGVTNAASFNLISGEISSLTNTSANFVISGTGASMGEGTSNFGTMTHQGSGSVTIYGTLNNQAGALYDLQGDGGLTYGYGGGTVNNAGTFRKSGGTGTSAVNVDFNNTGTVEVDSGTLNFPRGYQQTAGSLFLNGGSVTANANLQGGQLCGTGTVNGSITNAGTISPGNQLGSITVNGSLSLTSNSCLKFDIGGLTQGTQYDDLVLNSPLTLNGTLQLGLVNGFGASLLSGETFTLVTASSISGSFIGIPSGTRVETSDRLDTFVVNYGASSPYGANLIVLSQGQANQAPVASSQSLGLPKNTASTVNLVASDAEGDPLVYVIVSPPAHGTLTGTAPNLTYTPVNGYIGPDWFSWQASDGVSNSALATVSISIVDNLAWNAGLNGNWSDSTNWTNNLGLTSAGSPGYILNFNTAGTFTSTNDLNSGFLLNQLNFGGSAATLAGNSLAFAANGTILPQLNQNGSANVVVNNSLALTAVTTIGGSGTGTLTLSGAISGVGGLTKTGTGTHTLSNANTYTGSTIVNGGTIILSGSGTLANTSDITLGGGTLALVNTAQVNRVNDSAAISVTGGGSITYTNTSGANVYAETIGSVALTSGQLNLVETNNQASTGSQTLTLAGLSRTGGTNTSAVTFSSGSGLNTTKNMIVVTGAGTTTAGQIIGPWATTGTAANAQTDYAVYNGSAQVVPAAIAASAESGWTTAANAYTANAGLGAVTLTGTRNITAMRSISAANAVTVTASSANIVLASHTLNVGDAVVFSGTTAPTGLTFGTVYYVVNVVAGTSFQVSATKGGGGITPTSAGSAVKVTGVTLVSTGNNLGTYGILNGVSTALTIAGTGTGAVTLPTTTAGNLYVNPGSGGITINAPITDNTGALTLVHDGSGTTTLNGTNTYSGGTVINGGQITMSSSDSNLGAAGYGITVNGSATLQPPGNWSTTRPITLNNGALLSIGGNSTFAISGNVTGNGGIYASEFNFGSVVQLTGTGNTFQGPILIGLNGGVGSQLVGVTAASLLDSSTANGPIIIGSGATHSTSYGPSAPYFAYTGSANLTLNNRQIQLDTVGSGAANVANYGTGGATMTVNTDLAILNAGAKTLYLSTGGSAGANTFAGRIPDGPGAQVSVNVYSGTWTLSGANSYTGTTTVTAGTLSLPSIDVVANANPLGKSSAAAANLLLGNGTTLKYTGAAASTDRSFTINGTSAGHAATLDASGSGAINFTNTASPAYGTTAQTRTLNLTGTNTGNNTLAANIGNNSSGAVSLAKSGAGTWVLSGASTYTGNTTVSAGTLAVTGSLGATAVSVNSAATLAGNGNIGGNVTINSGAHHALAVAATAAAQVTRAITGTLTMTGSILDLSAATTPAAGTYVLATATTAITGTPTTINYNGIIGTVSVDGASTPKRLLLTVTSPGPGPVDHFVISAIGWPQTTGTAITGITLTAQDASNATATSFTGTVTFGGTGGFTGTSVAFTAGVLTGVSVTPTVAGSNLTLTVSDGAGHSGSTTIATVRTPYQAWAATNAPTGTAKDDADGDGVSNAVEYVLGGSKNTNDVAKLPKASTSGGNVLFTFTRDQKSIDGTTTVAFEVSADLATWPSAYTVGADTAHSDSGVTVIKDTSPGFDTVTLTVPQGSGSGKFARLKVLVATP